MGVLELAIDSSLLYIFIRFMYFREQHKYPMRTFLSVLIWFSEYFMECAFPVNLL